MVAMGLVRSLRDWLNLADYDAAKKKATKDIIKRYARGNVVFQNGGVMDEAEMAKLSAAGDAAIERLQKLGQRR